MPGKSDAGQRDELGKSGAIAKIAPSAKGIARRITIAPAAPQCARRCVAHAPGAPMRDRPVAPMRSRRAGSSRISPTPGGRVGEACGKNGERFAEQASLAPAIPARSPVCVRARTQRPAAPPLPPPRSQYPPVRARARPARAAARADLASRARSRARAAQRERHSGMRAPSRPPSPRAARRPQNAPHRDPARSTAPRRVRSRDAASSRDDVEEKARVRVRAVAASGKERERGREPGNRGVDARVVGRSEEIDDRVRRLRRDAVRAQRRRRCLVAHEAKLRARAETRSSKAP